MENTVTRVLASAIYEHYTRELYYNEADDATTQSVLRQVTESITMLCTDPVLAGELADAGIELHDDLPPDRVHNVGADYQPYAGVRIKFDRRTGGWQLYLATAVGVVPVGVAADQPRQEQQQLATCGSSTAPRARPPAARPYQEAPRAAGADPERGRADAVVPGTEDRPRRVGADLPGRHAGLPPDLGATGGVRPEGGRVAGARRRARPAALPAAPRHRRRRTPRHHLTRKRGLPTLR